LFDTQQHFTRNRSIRNQCSNTERLSRDPSADGLSRDSTERDSRGEWIDYEWGDYESRTKSAGEAGYVHAMLPELLNEVVVIDTDSRFTYIGRLTEIGDKFSRLEDAAVHNTDEGTVTIDQYLDECANFGFPVSRKHIWVRQEKVVSVSRLDDITKPGSEPEP